MLSSQFQESLQCFPQTIKFFDGIFAADLIPHKLRKNRFIICNTDTSDKPGSHWFCLIRFNESIECFDSLGVNEAKKTFLLSLPLCTQSNALELEFNCTQVQSNESSSCGEFVLYFLIQRLHNRDLEFNDLLNDIFDIDPSKNEMRVKSFHTLHFDCNG